MVPHKDRSHSHVLLRSRRLRTTVLMERWPEKLLLPLLARTPFHCHLNKAAVGAGGPGGDGATLKDTHRMGREEMRGQRKERLIWWQGLKSPQKPLKCFLVAPGLSGSWEGSQGASSELHRFLGLDGKWGAASPPWAFTLP